MHTDISGMRWFRLILRVCLGLTTSLVQAQYHISDTNFRAVQDNANSLDVDLTTVPDKVILIQAKDNNLALGKSVSVRYASNDPTKISQHATAWNPQLMVDGSIAANSFFELRPGQEGTQIRIDLQATRVVNHVITRIYPPSNALFRIRGYTLMVGRDTLSYAIVKQIVDNENVKTDDFFDPETARYVVLQVDKQDPTLGNPVSTTISEIQVFGVGYSAHGYFTSIVNNASMPVNWGGISWSGIIPANTSITMQLRTGSTPTYDSTSWSPWSEEATIPGELVTVYEPKQYAQYRVHLYTQTVTTPELDAVDIAYDTALVAASATAQIDPQTAPILKESDFQYIVKTTMDGRSTGIDTIYLLTTIPVKITGVTVDNAHVEFRQHSSSGVVRIGLANTITTSSTISVGLRFTPYLITSSFPGLIVSNANPGNPQWVDSLVVPGGAGWRLTTTGIPEQIIVSATADPNPFTPNNDGKNDVTRFNFFVSNLTDPRPVRLTVYDITGRTVRQLFARSTTAQAFVEQNAIVWDGRDDQGRRLPPGLYIYQIVVDTDTPSPSVVTKTVTLAY